MIEANYFWINIFLLAVSAFGIRFSVIAVSKKLPITDRHKEIFTFIPAAILPAMTSQMVFFHQGQVGGLFGKERLVILLLAGVVCYFTRNLLATVGFGLVALYLLTQL